jgi:hypothetical protein
MSLKKGRGPLRFRNSVNQLKEISPMKEMLFKTLAPLAAVFFFAGSAIAATSAPAPADFNNVVAQTEKPVDCKKFPEDPRCKDRK